MWPFKKVNKHSPTTGASQLKTDIRILLSSFCKEVYVDSSLSQESFYKITSDFKSVFNNIEKLFNNLYIKEKELFHIKNLYKELVEENKEGGKLCLKISQ